MYTDTAEIPSIVNTLRETFQTGKMADDLQLRSMFSNSSFMLQHRSHQGQGIQKTTAEKLSQIAQRESARHYRRY